MCDTYPRVCFRRHLVRRAIVPFAFYSSEQNGNVAMGGVFPSMYYYRRPYNGPNAVPGREAITRIAFPYLHFESEFLDEWFTSVVPFWWDSLSNQTRLRALVPIYGWISFVNWNQVQIDVS